MSIATIVREKMVDAMKVKDKKTKDIYAYLLDQIQKEDKNRKNKDNPNPPPLTEAEEIAVIERVVKQIRTGVDKTIKQANEKEKISEETKKELDAYIADRELEIKMYSEFLPKNMDADEINALINEVINSLGDNVNKGLVMKNLMPKIKAAGRADGKMVSELVEAALKK
jgi:uncharacterized protein YqeY